jgi:hypothetical protein
VKIEMTVNKNIEVACSTKQWELPFFVTLQCEETKGIIHSRIKPAIKAFLKEL